MKLDNEENTLIDQTRPRVVVQMHIMGATICPSTFQDTPQPPWYHIGQLFPPKPSSCVTSSNFKTSLSVLHAIFTICFRRSEFWCCSWACAAFSSVISLLQPAVILLTNSDYVRLQNERTKERKTWGRKKYFSSQQLLIYICWDLLRYFQNLKFVKS